MSEGSEISLGDLVRALSRLGLTETEAIRDAAETLGLPLGALRSSLRPQVVRPEPAVASAAAGGVTVTGGEGAADAVGTAAVPAKGDDFLLRHEGRVPPVPPAWAQRGAILTTPTPVAAPPDLEPWPLLSPATPRALLAALVGGQAASGPLDVAKAVEVLARGRALDQIPRLDLPTLRYGVQVLVDRAAALLPYREDQRRVIGDLRRLISPDRLQVLRFAGSPLRAGPSTPRTWKAYEPPPAGSTVLILSDLGLCRGDGLDEAAPLAHWVDFAARVRRAGAQAVALVPYAARRWPRALGGRMTLVFWDRPTTVAGVRARRRRGGER